MKQLKLSSSVYFKSQPSFGGELNLNKRKSRRPLDPKKPLHIVLRVAGHKPVFLHQDPLINKIIEWGRDFKSACAYVIKNQKEAWGLISYQPRAKRVPT